jgi:hypothetical protein
MDKIEKKKGKYDKVKMFKDGANLSPVMEFLLRREITDLLETADFRIEWFRKHKAPYPFSKLNQSQKQPEGEDAKIRLLNEAMLSVIEEELDKRKK